MLLFFRTQSRIYNPIDPEYLRFLLFYAHDLILPNSALSRE